MHRFLSGSHARKAAALCVAVVGFVLLYETRMLDSQTRGLAGVFGAEQEPEPGARLPFSATAYCKGTTTASGVRVRLAWPPPILRSCPSAASFKSPLATASTAASTP